jgi:hypothetical protein
MQMKNMHMGPRRRALSAKPAATQVELATKERKDHKEKTS